MLSSDRDLCRRVLDSARDVVFVIDASGTIIDANHAAQGTYGFSLRQLLGMRLSDLRAPSTLGLMPEQMRAAADRGLLFETVHVRADGQQFAVEVSSRGIELADGPGFVSVIRDISDRRAHEAERERLLQELEDTNRRLDTLVRIVSGALGTLELDDLLCGTLALLRAETGADAAMLVEVLDDGMVVAAQVDDRVQSSVGLRFSAGEGFCAQVAAAGAPLYVPDVTESDFALPVHDSHGLRSMFGVPMFLAGRLYGVLELAWNQCRQIDEDGIRLVQAAADRMMLAIANAKLYGQAKRAEALSAALNDVNSLVNSSFDLSQTMAPALKISAEALGCDVAVLAAASDGVWTARYAHGVDLTSTSLAYSYSTDGHGTELVSAPVAGTPTYDWLASNLGLVESLTVKLVVRGEQVGRVLFGRREARGGFDDVGRDYAGRFGGAIALALANGAEFESEHKIAERLQEALLTTPTSVRGIDFSHLYRSATVSTRVGGDFYDLFELAYGRVGVVIGDVSGKGLEAAVLTSVIKDTIRALAHDMPSPADVMARANIALGRAAKLPEFASVFFAVIETRTASMTYCCAGHPPAALITAEGDVHLLGCNSAVIGAFEDLEYVEESTPLAPGERIFLYTDGVTEARAAADGFFGEERLVATLRQAAGSGLSEIPSTVYSAVMDFTDGRLSDDIALLAFQLT
jgi:PAS domain S-box-containing protein